MKKFRFVTGAIAAMALMFFTGCQDVGNEQTGRIVVKITDAPFPIGLIEEANVTITRVEVRNQDEGEEGPFITLFEGSEDFNLVELRNGIMAELVDMEVPVGTYDLIRIYVENASIAVKDHETYSVKVPSGSQTGVKVFITPGLKVAGGLTAEVMLDFSLEKSFVLKGNMDTPAGIKGFNFKPVIRAVNSTTAGTLKGVVTDTVSNVLENAAVSISQDEVIATAYTDETGAYAFPGLAPGYYTVIAELDGFVADTANQVEVVEGNMTLQDFVLETVPPETE